MKLINSSTKEIVELDNQTIKIYNCGPTVYNHIHIGNARPLVVFDVLYRYLRFIGKEVQYVLNITDIDDKIIKKAIEENKTEKEISEFYYNEYLIIKKALNTLEMSNPKVSDNIDGIIYFISELISKGFAYELDGDVYFDTSKVQSYGCISNNKIDELEIGNRIDSNVNKKNSTDFVLWKKTNEGIKWDTKWSLGRPGWHTECVYLINKYLDKQIDIHGGGMDLKFPHHENENAQNMAINNCGLSKVWMHIGMININNEKMSKSLNNFILVKDILKKYSYQSLRWFFYQTSYSNPLNYSDEIMQKMNNDISKIEKQINQVKTAFIMNDINVVETNDLDEEFISHLDNNLNITNAITCVHFCLKELNKFIRAKDFENSNKYYNIVLNQLYILGIEFNDKHTPDVIAKIQKYKELIAKKEFDDADIIRESLISKGIW